MNDRFRLRAVAAAVSMTLAGVALASSHREAPFITNLPKVDASDFYMFNSYEAGRAGFVTLIANYLPLQEPYGGPNYFTLDPEALYEIHVDNNGDGAEDLTFQFRFTRTTQGLAVMAGGKSIPVPLTNIGPVSAADSSKQNVAETYSLTVVKGDRRHGMAAQVSDAGSGSTTFTKPLDNIGAKSIPDYATYAASFIHTITIPGCNTPGKVFVGQRKDPFVVNLGETFDLVNIKYPATELNPLAESATIDSLADANVTSFVLEVPAACLTEGKGTIVGGWTTASVPQSRVVSSSPTAGLDATTQSGSLVQVSRVGAPL